MNGSLAMQPIIKALLLILLTFTGRTVVAQADSLRMNDPIKVIARPAGDSIMLRWAPIETRYWLSANERGYTVERYTLLRNGKPLARPEKKIMGTVMPYAERQWESVVRKSKYTAIAAQALLGEYFQLTLEESDVVSIVNSAKENDQRFSIALFCADLSVTTAKALGLYYVDTTVEKNEKYLYRIISLDSKGIVIHGSVYIASSDGYTLPKPKDLIVSSESNRVTLQWNHSDHKRIYTTYLIERSDNGNNFIPVFEDPITTLSPTLTETKYQYANDTLPQFNKEYNYRIVGISPFGETGPYSDVKKIIAKKKFDALPHITSATSLDNKTITVEWELPHEFDNAVEGFFVERAISPSSPYNKANPALLDKEARFYKDESPAQTNYYRVTVLTINDEIVQSPDYYSQLVDSIPPAAPVGMKGRIDENGHVSLAWKPNADRDIYGYRVYRAYYTSEEFSQLTDGPIPDAAFEDTVQLKALNDKVHYRIVAIDNNQNQSTLSEIYSFTLPDKVSPMPPVFLPVRSSLRGIELNWIASGSLDVIRYDLFRKDTVNWIKIASIPAENDSLYNYVDVDLKDNEQHYYTLVAVDDANLASPHAAPVSGQKLKKSIWPAVTLAEPQIIQSSRTILLKWNYELVNVRLYHIYKALNNEPLKLYRSVFNKEFSDQLFPRSRYVYKVVAVFNDGSRSEMGEGVTIEF
jgi:hypothetical protein